MKFNVEISDTTKYYFNVEANDKFEAQAKVWQLYVEGLNKGTFGDECYNSTTDTTITKVEEEL